MTLPSAHPNAKRPAASFSSTTSEPGKIAAAIVPALASVPHPAGALLFASGALAETAEQTFRSVRSILGPIATVLATGAGVLTESGELERTSALSGILWSDGEAVPIAVPLSVDPKQVGDATIDAIRNALDGRAGTVMLFAEPDKVAPRTFDRLAERLPHATVVGGGTLPRGAWSISDRGDPIRGAVVGLVLRGLPRPVVRTSAACKLLGSPQPITACRGPMVLQIGDKPALEVLSACARGLSGQPLVFAVLTEGDHDPRPGQGNVLVRGIRGVDPARGGVLVTDEVEPGMRLCFGIRDGASSRADLESAMREVSREIAGAAPRFGVFVSCAGRGIGLYGAADVDTAILRGRFPNLPLAGLFSSFEIAPCSKRTTMHLYTAVVSLFSAPS